MHLPISISLTSITYPSPSPPLLIRPTHSKLAAAITGNIKHRLRRAPSDRYHTDHRQTPTVTAIIIVGNDHTRERERATNPRRARTQICSLSYCFCAPTCRKVTCANLLMHTKSVSGAKNANLLLIPPAYIFLYNVQCDYFPAEKTINIHSSSPRVLLTVYLYSEYPHTPTPIRSPLSILFFIRGSPGGLLFFFQMRFSALPPLVCPCRKGEWEREKREREKRKEEVE